MSLVVVPSVVGVPRDPSLRVHGAQRHWPTHVEPRDCHKYPRREATYKNKLVFTATPVFQILVHIQQCLQTELKTCYLILKNCVKSNNKILDISGLR